MFLFIRRTRAFLSLFPPLICASSLAIAAAPDPADSRVVVPVDSYRSAFKLQSLDPQKSETPDQHWRAANKAVGMTSGHGEGHSMTMPMGKSMDQPPPPSAGKALPPGSNAEKDTGPATMDSMQNMEHMQHEKGHRP